MLSERKRGRERVQVKLGTSSLLTLVCKCVEERDTYTHVTAELEKEAVYVPQIPRASQSVSKSSLSLLSLTQSQSVTCAPTSQPTSSELSH